MTDLQSQNNSDSDPDHFQVYVNVRYSLSNIVQ